MKGNVKVQSIRHESRHLEYKLIHNLYVLLPLRADTKQYPSMPVRSVCIYWCTSSGGYAAVSFFYACWWGQRSCPKVRVAKPRTYITQTDNAIRNYSVNTSAIQKTRECMRVTSQ